MRHGNARCSKSLGAFTRIRLARLCRLLPQRLVDLRKAVVPRVRHLTHGAINRVDQLPPFFDSDRLKRRAELFEVEMNLDVLRLPDEFEFRVLPAALARRKHFAKHARDLVHGRVLPVMHDLVNA